MSTLKEKVQVIILPSKEKTNIRLNTYINETHKNADKLDYYNFDNNYTVKDYEDRGYQFQHLYILSDEEIKDGDWYIYNNELLRQFNEKTNPSAKLIKRNKKIIATTDNSISKPEKGYNWNSVVYPKPSQGFIDKYIKEYNKGNIITDILVEYHFIGGINGMFKSKELLVKDDNTITIHPIKTSWSREEVLAFGKKCFDYGVICESGQIPFEEIGESKRWMENNL